MIFSLLLLLASLFSFSDAQAGAGDEASFTCANEADWKRRGCDQALDKNLVSAIVNDCRAIGGAIHRHEGVYRALVIKCAKSGSTLNRAAPKKLRRGQAPVNEDTSRLLEQNRALMADCARQMGELEKAFQAEAAKLEPKLADLKATDKCGPLAQRFYQALKQRADNGAQMAKAKVGEFGGAETAMEAKREVTKNNAAGLGGDQNKAKDEGKKDGAGGGGGDPSSIMKALGDAAKMKQDADAKKAAEEKAAAEKEKARLAQEKTNRIQQCRSNERDRQIEITNCENKFYVDPRYPIVSTQKAAQLECIDGVNAARGLKVADCNLIP